MCPQNLRLETQSLTALRSVRDFQRRRSIVPLAVSQSSTEFIATQSFPFETISMASVWVGSENNNVFSPSKSLPAYKRSQ